MKTARFFPAFLAATFLARADVLPPAQDSSSLRGKLTLATGKATTLAVSATRKGYVSFNLNSLPLDVHAADIASVRLRVYFPSTTKPGEILVHSVAQEWNEGAASLEPGISASPIAQFPVETVVGKKFVEVDVTDTVRAWREGTAENFGFAFVASGKTNVLIGAKEGAGSGYPCELEVEIARQLPSDLTLGGTTSGAFSGNGSGLMDLNAANFSSGTLGDVRLSGNVPRLNAGANTFVGSVAASAFSGSGSGLLSLNAANISSGTLGDARLSGNIPLLNAGANTFAGSVTASGFSGNGSGLTGVAASSFANAPTDVLPALGMVWIKPGTFIMGSVATEVGRSSDETQHAVTLTKGFWMGVHEVTQAEYQAVTGSNPSFYTGDTTRPVEQVQWTQAVAYCATLTTSEQTAGRIPAGWSYRLPTEAEWEYCCRAGARTTRFSYDDDLSAIILPNHAWFTTNGNNQTHPVGQKLSNPWGLMDMHGNVWEWCQDWYGSYPSGSVADPQGPATGTIRVIRGGSFTNTAATCRSARRLTDVGGGNASLGFRVVLSAN